MRNLHVRALLVVLLLAFAAACGNDDDNGPTNTTGQTIPTTPTTAAGTTIRTTSTTIPGVQQGVTDGAVCSPVGARGQTNSGLAVVCGAGAAGGESRWRPA